MTGRWVNKASVFDPGNQRSKDLKHWAQKVRPSQVALLVKNRPANAGDVGDTGLIPGLGRSPGGGHGSPFQYSCLENPMDRGAWQATVHGVAKRQTWLKWLSTHSFLHISVFIYNMFIYLYWKGRVSLNIKILRNRLPMGKEGRKQNKMKGSE